jgi:DNA-binding LacI/PurR family transcriptional regulator
MRKHVQECAKELGYVKNFMASNLSKQESFAVGLTIWGKNVNSYDNGFWNPIIGGAEVELAKQDKSLILIGEGYDDNSFKDCRSYKYIQSNRIGSLILSLDAYWFEDYDKVKANIVWLMQPRHGTHPVVSFDPLPGMDEALDHLLEWGHKNIFWFGNEIDPESIYREKILTELALSKGMLVTAFNGSFGKSGVKRDLVSYIDNYKKDVFRILADSKLETAAVCYNETIASAVYGSLNEQAKLIPRDFSVIAFDDIFAHTFYPALTVISHELSEIGATAARIAMELDSDPDAYEKYRGYRKEIPGRLVKYNSVAKASK